MVAVLYFRSMGCHKPIKEVKLPCALETVFDGEKVDEEKVLSMLPDDFLETSPEKTLLTVEKNGYYEGQYKLKKFRSWGKYFDAYCLELGRK